MKTLVPGQTLLIEASDAAFPADLEAWLIGRPDKLLSLECRDGFHAAVLEKRVPL